MASGGATGGSSTPAASPPRPAPAASPAGAAAARRLPRASAVPVRAGPGQWFWAPRRSPAPRPDSAPTFGQSTLGVGLAVDQCKEEITKSNSIILRLEQEIKRNNARIDRLGAKMKEMDTERQKRVGEVKSLNVFMNEIADQRRSEHDGSLNSTEKVLKALALLIDVRKTFRHYYQNHSIATGPIPDGVEGLEEEYARLMSLSQKDAGAEFKIVFDKTTGQMLGLKSNLQDVVFLRIKEVLTGGLVQQWNDSHPELAVRPGDCIVEANGIRSDARRMIEECMKDQILELMVERAQATTAPQMDDARAAGTPREAACPRAAGHGATSGAEAGAEAEAKGTVSVAVPTASGQVRIRISPRQAGQAHVSTSRGKLDAVPGG